MKRILQLIGIILGLVALVEIGFGLFFVSDLVQSRMEFRYEHFITGFFIFLFCTGIYSLYVAYIVAMRFSKTAIKHLCFLFSLIVFIYFPRIAGNPHATKMRLLLDGLSVIVAVLVYFISVKVLIRWWSKKNGGGT
jgi:hypothetical protein